MTVIHFNPYCTGRAVGKRFKFNSIYDPRLPDVLTLFSGFPKYIFKKHQFKCFFYLLDPQWRPTEGFTLPAEDLHPDET